jgi:acetone carboxylase gamma subunit
VEANVVPFAKMLVGDDAWGSVLGHAGRIGGPNVDLTSVAILVDKVEFNEPVTMNVNIEAFDVDGVAEHGVVSCKEGGTIGLHADVGTCIHKEKSSGRMRH